jgi:DNA-binding NtrC family response regulator
MAVDTALKIAVIDDEASARKMIERFMNREGYEVATFPDGRSFLQAFRSTPFDIIISDLKLPDIDGIEILQKVREVSPDTELIIITGFATIETAVEATRKGAFNYLPKPCRKKDILAMVEEAGEKILRRQEGRKLEFVIDPHNPVPGFVGSSPAMTEIFKLIKKVAQVNCNVLLEAETGTGKQVVARAIHDLSLRSRKPFVYFNCGGFAEDLICNELFGHEKGAFTGANSLKKGLFETGAGGTILLDEIGEMPMSMQVKLLHVLQERQIIRVGGNRPIDLDIRIIAATNRDLEKEIARGRFREDLFYRLNVVRIQIPSLARRKEDIPVLAEYFIEKYNKAFGKNVKEISPHVLKYLLRYAFPGNVRELENMIQRAVVLAEDDEIRLSDMPDAVRSLAWEDMEELNNEPLVPLEDMERAYISKVLELTDYNKKKASDILKLPRTTLWRRMKQFGLDRKK